MTKQEYEMLQKRLTKKLCLNPYRPGSSAKYKEGYREGILADKSILHEFYQDYPPGNFGEDGNRKEGSKC